ncbi:MAG: ISL3 family transposase [Planctomycetota bacterium]
MHDKDLYAAILGIRNPWIVTSVELDSALEEIRVKIEAAAGTSQRCPKCQVERPGYDTRKRSWRHLDTCQFKTILEADVPRVNCAEHGVLQIDVPWSEPNSGFTSMMECLIIDWLGETSITGVARRMRLTWDEIDGVMQRAVVRGMSRRKSEKIEQIGVDEVAFRKRHEYTTVVNDTRESRVLYVGEGRGKDALDLFYQGLASQQRFDIKIVSMDMWPAYVRSTVEHIWDAHSKIAFDRFHVAKHLGEAVDQVRRKEHSELQKEEIDTLKGTKFLWLQNQENMEGKRRIQFAQLRDLHLKVARAWAIKETARQLWGYVRRGWAEKAWKSWITWALKSRLEPIQRAATMVKNHLWGILNAITLRANNATAESLNAKIQWIKKMACGFRNSQRFINAIYFHCGKLDMYPRVSCGTHTNS